jgi:hypothetical protein
VTSLAGSIPGSSTRTTIRDPFEQLGRLVRPYFDRLLGPLQVISEAEVCNWAAEYGVRSD